MPSFNHTHIEYELQLIYETEMSNARRLMYHVSTSPFEWIKYFASPSLPLPNRYEAAKKIEQVQNLQ